MAVRAKKNILAKRFAHAISVSVHHRDFEHTYVYWIWLRGSASYVIKLIIGLNILEELLRERDWKLYLKLINNSVLYDFSCIRF